MADADLTVVGAGIVGLAVAARLAPRIPNLVVLERHARHGQETSSRNSEVIHAGMYYATGSLKARLCVEGNRRLYELAARHDIPVRRCGKIITATCPEEIAALEHLHVLGKDNGVALRRISAEDVHALEPNVTSVGALLSPATGIVNAHRLMDYFAHAALGGGAILQTRTRLVGIERRTSDYALHVETPDGIESFTSERIVNAAGLEADTVAGLAGIDVDAAGYRLHWCKGSYFSVGASKATLVSRLVYPVPGQVSLGVHAVLDLSGRLKFGPDAEYLRERNADYHVDPELRPAFAQSVKRLVPAIEEDDLQPDMSGIRAKLQGPSDGFRDFLIREESDRGLPGLVNLVGIDSPGLTASPAIASYVEGLLR
jgi:L-2-hydroxyglutarate oxidase LhgO